ncbi:hypothetical protein GUITHDRAFT_138009 [Guillardia theta CCMP2712]|uniref:Uncharacterized protein n=1 Tax=Guillardia theta (strain CCMP2712) TaxID=905079 RepID=L1JDK2_GUITC|nr:hypothetical protein GUITHDRAFT_138009 [Guillardia theta CCMP2712]EKX46618.1 hypothetical protein GUITHDRAFT_138009 [Guillardia theta CCMP2712]|eukprot:XP_005833598.1 hypothetical protein GUITHDRAFT_138009 [Guillardia theta CCMP2712]
MLFAALLLSLLLSLLAPPSSQASSWQLACKLTWHEGGLTNFSTFFDGNIPLSFQQLGVFYASLTSTGVPSYTLRNRNGVFVSSFQASWYFSNPYQIQFGCSAEYTYLIGMAANFDSSAEWQLLYEGIIETDFAVDSRNTSKVYSFQMPKECEWRSESSGSSQEGTLNRDLYDALTSGNVDATISSMKAATPRNFYYSQVPAMYVSPFSVVGSSHVPCFDCPCSPDPRQQQVTADSGRCVIQACNVSQCKRVYSDALASCVPNDLNVSELSRVYSPPPQPASTAQPQSSANQDATVAKPSASSSSACGVHEVSWMARSVMAISLVVSLFTCRA